MEMEVQMSPRSIINIMMHDHDFVELLGKFPAVKGVFAYGSGAIKQGGYDYSSENLPMLDLVFVVDDSLAWHQENMTLNPSHYTTLIPFSGSLIAYLQDNMGAAMWYNTTIPMNIKRFPKRFMKYGVISQEKFVRDLTEWKWLYVAGRLHKPVMIFRSNDAIDQAMRINREHAVRTSLLLLPDHFSEMNFYTSIAGISYMGDPRMAVGGENPHKVQPFPGLVSR